MDSSTPRIYPPDQAKAMVIKEKMENPEMKALDISRKLNIPLNTVTMWLRSADLKRKADDIQVFIEKAVLEDKVPIIRAIGDAGLIALFEWLSTFIEKGSHLDMEVETANKLTNMVERLHSMYRLEMGKSTSNLSFMIEKTERNINVILSNLQKPPELGGDPFGMLPEAVDVEPSK